MTVPATTTPPEAPASQPNRWWQRWRGTAMALPGPLLLLLGAAEATWSVVRYDWRIVAVYTTLAGLLTMWLWRRGGHVRWTPGAGAVVLVMAAILVLNVPTFTYLAEAPARTVRCLLAASALIAGAAQLLPWRHGPDVGLAVAVGGYLAATALLIDGDPAPRIDVWYTLQGAADALARGSNPYTQVWVGPPGPMEAFTYLPWMAVLLAPGRWLAGDVRWALAAVTVAGALAVRILATGRATASDSARAGGTARGPAAAAALVLLLPGMSTQIEQAWTEPLLMACLVGASAAFARRRMLLAAVLLALALASKQHVAVLLPVLAAWPRLGPRRVLVAAGLSGMLLLPFLAAGPAAMWHDTVTLLIDFPPLKFSDTLFIAALHQLHWLPPFWLVGTLVLATVGSVSWVVHHRDPDPGELLRWAALVLLIANLLNKQAFYNQYWLVMALLVSSWAVPPSERAQARSAETQPAETQPAETQPTG